MDAVVIVAIVSIIGNILQFLLGKKSVDIDNLQKQLDLTIKLYEERGRVSDAALKARGVEITRLNDKMKEQDKLIQDNTFEIERMRKIITRMIGDGCHRTECKRRIAYSPDEINSNVGNSNVITDTEDGKDN